MDEVKPEASPNPNAAPAVPAMDAATMARMAPMLAMLAPVIKKVEGFVASQTAHNEEVEKALKLILSNQAVLNRKLDAITKLATDGTSVSG